MVKAELHHNPYLIETDVLFNGNKPRINCKIEKYRNKPLKDWVSNVPDLFYGEMNGYDFELRFSGTERDYKAIKEAFKAKGVSEDDVRVTLKRTFEDADTKSRKTDDLVNWLIQNPNDYFDAQTFIEENKNFFEEKYLCLVLYEREIPQDNDDMLMIETLDGIDELPEDLPDIPVIFSINRESERTFRKELVTVLGRPDVRQEQLFFMISPYLDKRQIIRVIRDLGVITPCVITDLNDRRFQQYIRDYPVTEYIHNAIDLFRTATDGIKDELNEKGNELKQKNAETHRELDELESKLQKLKSAEKKFEQNVQYNFSKDFQILKNNLQGKILSWKSRKDTITGDMNGRSYADDFSNKAGEAEYEFKNSLKSLYESEKRSIDLEFARYYSAVDFAPDEKPEEAFIEELSELDFPGIVKDLLEIKESAYEEPKSDLIGFFLKGTEEKKEPVLVTTYYLGRWRNMAMGKIIPVAEQAVEKCQENLTEYWKTARQNYLDHIYKLTAETTKSRDEKIASLSGEEKKYQADCDWYQAFDEQLSSIERD